MASISASGEDAIARSISLDIDLSTSSNPQLTSVDEFREFYEVERVGRHIKEGGYKRVALQFPDELLHHSVPIYRLLKDEVADETKETQTELYVLADTSYGSCCVDEVAAQHVDADLMVHYGHACMSKTYRLPVIYVFGRKPLDVDDCVTNLVQCLDTSESLPTEVKKVIRLRYDVGYNYLADTLLDKLQTSLPDRTVLYTRTPLRSEPSSTNNPSSSAPTSAPIPSTSHPNSDPRSNVDNPKTRIAEENEESKSTILYVGCESLGLTNLLMTHSHQNVYSYNPSTHTTRLESSRTNKLLMRRYATVQKARDADVFGILVGTLGVASYLPLISHLRHLLNRAHKKSYTISVGKLNPAKLANFMEVECFVLVACPENSLVEAKEFLKPIVTPYELEIALKAEQSWTGERYVLDFEKLLAGQQHRPDEEHGNGDSGEDKDEGEDVDIDEPVFSTITGKYRKARRFGVGDKNMNTSERENGGSDAVILRNKDDTVARLPDSAAADFLQARTFRGLETRVGLDRPSVLEQGRSGIARGYGDDVHES